MIRKLIHHKKYVNLLQIKKNHRNQNRAKRSKNK